MFDKYNDAIEYNWLDLAGYQATRIADSYVAHSNSSAAHGAHSPELVIAGCRRDAARWYRLAAEHYKQAAKAGLAGLFYQGARTAIRPEKMPLPINMPAESARLVALSERFGSY